MTPHVHHDRTTASIAVVGMGCRLPPDCRDPESFWGYLESGGNAIITCPDGRWKNGPAPRAGFLQGSFPAGFDAAFFEISPREARDMDPQQRLLLECCWKALEDAAWPAARLRGREIGTYIGITTADYQRATLWDAAEPADLYTATGTALASAAGRISYVFGFEGPAMAVDTACSSSLVAIHLACQALRNGECEAALAGGVNALLAPHAFACLETMGLLAPDGESRSFDGSASGYVRGEGCGVVLLKPLDAAIRDGDRVLAVCRGSAVNQNGRGGSFTAPGAAAQARLIRRALECAGLLPTDIDYVEAHGTGTPLGDAVELNTLLSVYGSARASGRPLRIGSVKSNIGHLEAGAGIAGFIKAVQCLRHSRIPAQIHVQRPNPEVRWESGYAEIPKAAIDWPRNGQPRRAGVSSFGFTGTNAHVIVEEAPAVSEPPPDRTGCPMVHLLPISARSPQALERLAERYRKRLQQPGIDLHDFCHTAATGRSHFAHRLAVVGSNAAELVRGIEQRLQRPVRDAAPRAGLGPQLRAALEPCDAIFREARGESLFDLLAVCDTGACEPALGGPPDRGGGWTLLFSTLAELYTRGLDVDWDRFYRPWPGRKISLPAYPFERRPYYREPASQSVGMATADLGMLASAVGNPGEHLLDIVNRMARTVLGESLSERLDDDLPLVEQGFDSLAAAGLRTHLEQIAGRPLPVSLLYNYPSLRRIANFLEQQAAPAPSPPVHRDFHTLRAEGEFDFLEHMEAAELAALIDRDLNSTTQAND